MQNYFSSEFLASGLSAEFNDFITRITQAKSKTVSATIHLDTVVVCIDISVIGRNEPGDRGIGQIVLQDGIA